MQEVTVQTKVEVTVNVRLNYTTGSPGKMYMRNGDPGYPPEPAEIEFLEATLDDDLDSVVSVAMEDDDFYNRLVNEAEEKLQD